MLAFFASAASGWVATLALAFGALLPYLLRPTAIARLTGLQLTSRQSYLLRMWPHYWAGYAVAGISTVHAWIAMSAPHKTPSSGLWLATAAWGVIGLQVWCGLALRDGVTSRTRLRLRRFHFWSMVACTGLIVLHIGVSG